uniref:General secretion pathway protein D n=1 Tax=Candidatus Kentrum sp. TUN TaxID=2126343 RepID=A0A450ZCE6_9GAMM|nr:MAG: general secretion pathway protein D [Candidatus Kentron sp. TUN]VFK51453.1 MAG: general secretion pathway protein D [Candidatus Kentron sp. TUN]VFK59499.1 MAG: general secretion pathway protein D [Candidatus Kentron sp. TUN]
MRSIFLSGIFLLLTACASPPTSPHTPSSGHLQRNQPQPQPDSRNIGIPKPVTRIPVLAPPQPLPPQETYTIVVNEVPVKELLFAIARDAAINVDIHPDIRGVVTVNAVDQTLTRILERIEGQVAIRHELRDDTLVVMSDTPFLKTYRVDYVNMERSSSSRVGTSTKIATSSGPGADSGEGNISNTLITNTSGNRFWRTLTRNILAILDEMPNAEAPGLGRRGENASASEEEGSSHSNAVIVNAESGLVTVRATAKQHADIRTFIDQVMANARRQVLIEATIVEVELSDSHQAGIDWETFATGAGLRAAQSVMGAFPVHASTAGTSGLTLNYADAASGSAKLDVSLTVKLLRQFGNTRVLSSPKIMTLNNQTALLKVVDNEVYFEIELEEKEDAETNTTDLNIKSKVKTVPVGLLMNVTPQINDLDSVILNVRPTITRIKEYREDPGVAIIANRLAASNVANKVPVVQVRETESVLEVKSRRIAVIGGLMQDRIQRDQDSVPWLGDIPGIGNLFKYRHRNSIKTELVIFLRPTIIRDASIQTDLGDFRQFLGEE